MSLSDFAYSVLLKPKPLRLAVNATLRSIVRPVVRRNGATIALNPNDPVVSGALTLGVYEPLESQFFLSVCRPGMTFLDIGANCGYYTAMFLSRAGSDARVVALEPDPQCFAYLHRTIEANCATAVTCMAKAASDRAGIVSLYCNPDNRGDNRLYANSLGILAHQVEAVTVDDAFLGLGLRSVDLIKMDVQGYEAKVSRGMKRLIANSPELILLSEFWPWGLCQAGDSAQALLEWLETAGLTVFHLESAGVLRPIGEFKSFSARYAGRQYTNIVAIKGSASERLVFHHA